MQRKWVMRTEMILALMTLSPAILIAEANAAEAVQEKTCIFAAATKLPPVPGLEIVHSSTGPVPANVTQTAPWYGAVNPIGGPGKAATMMVDLDVQAAAQSATFEFVCGYNDGVTTAEPLGIAK